jgi:CheY-like chemotaxis protein
MKLLLAAHESLEAPMVNVLKRVKKPELMVEPESTLVETFPNLEGLRVLAVDDDIDTLDLLVFILEQCQAQVKIATSVKVALEVFSQFRPHLLISDIGMPEEDGYSLIHQIRTLTREQGGEIPAIALTAFAKDEERHQALAAGFEIHISKPVEPIDLIKIIVDYSQNLESGDF